MFKSSRFTFALFRQKWTHLVITRQNKVLDISAFKIRGRVQCVTWYGQTLSLTTIWKIFQNSYQKTPPAGTIIFR